MLFVWERIRSSNRRQAPKACGPSPPPFVAVPAPLTIQHARILDDDAMMHPAASHCNVPVVSCTEMRPSFCDAVLLEEQVVMRVGGLNQQAHRSVHQVEVS